MAAPMQLYCWKGDYGLPSVDIDCLTVLAYAKFAGAPLKVHKLTNPWRSPTGILPTLQTRGEGSVSQPSKIIIHLRKQKYNADYDLSAKEGADTLAFVSLLEEKLLPALIYTLWIDSKNYVDVTRRWYAENVPFPLNFVLPNRMHAQRLGRLQLVREDPALEPGEQLEQELYQEALECMTLLSQRLGSQKFFFGDSPSALDAYVFGHLAPLLKIKLPNRKLQQYLSSLENLQLFCTNILALYFPSEIQAAPVHTAPTQADGGDMDHEPHKRWNQVMSVLFAMGAMLGYAILTGIITIKSAHPHLQESRHDDVDEEGEEED
ncbi:metaxin-1b isoform X1 [Electrophorus electricus]|uniref:metaxin-1b isoform X1 n=1 Tax=Electrophorus electricus TaxID=8005 RepID=UPI0015CFAC37|nr:metaxin-1b isoform X1 [Electrophorus electricus]